MPFNSLIVAAAVGALAGLHASIWGMYKDAVHEGFGLVRFFRSVIIGALCGVLVQTVLAFDLQAPSAMLLLFGLAYAAERGIVETWKTFFRDEDQSKYFIPMQFSIAGKPVRSPGLRMLAGCGYVIVVGLCLAGVNALDRRVEASALSAGIAGLVVGLIIAIGGGWKDAPKEGFDLLKFFRSPIMTVIYAVVLSAFTNRHLLIAVASIGFERATAETYKTFFFPSKPRGKFSGMPIAYPRMLKHRQWFIAPYAAIWVGIITLGALAFRDQAAQLLAQVIP